MSSQEVLSAAAASTPSTIMESLPPPTPSTPTMTMTNMMDELMSMGYSPTTCQRALEVSGYDLEQAVGYLLMGEDSQQNFHDHHHDHPNQHGAAVDEKDETSETAENEPGALLPGVTAPNRSFEDVLPGVVVAVGNIADGQPSSDIDRRDRHHHQQQQEQQSATQQSSKEEEELVNMGYSQKDAKEALKIAHGDITQAIGFLCMGESRNKFMVTHDDSSNNHDNDDDHDFKNDSTIAAALLEEDLRNQYHAQCKAVAAMEQQREHHQGPSHNHQGLKPPPNYATSSTPLSATTATSSLIIRHSNKPKIVSTQTFLKTKEALPFCICVCASKFLSGGVVSTTFFHSIMESGIELYRKEIRKNKKDKRGTNNVGTVLRKYGKSSYLRISVVPAMTSGDVGDPRRQHGLFMEHDLDHGTSSIRHLLRDCRNEQGTGWRVVIIDLDNDNDNDNDNDDYDGGDCEAGNSCDHSSCSDSFCICLPPKGTTNKFWFFDFLPRHNVQTSGAYALVHSTLQHLEESIVLVFKTIIAHRRRQNNNNNINCMSFTFYQIKKI